MTAYTLYYYIPWPDSQSWFEKIDLIRDGYVVPWIDSSVFVDKDIIDNRNGL